MPNPNGTQSILGTIVQLVVILAALLAGFTWVNSSKDAQFQSVNAKFDAINVTLTAISERFSAMDLESARKQNESDPWTASMELTVWERFGRENPGMVVPDINDLRECQ